MWHPLRPAAPLEVPGPLGQLALNVEEVMLHLVLESVDKPRIPATTPAIPDRNGGRCSSVVTPRNVWIGTLGTAQNAVSFTTGPSKPGRSSSVCFEVQPRSGNVVTQWSRIREALCTGPTGQLPHLLR